MFWFSTTRDMHRLRSDSVRQYMCLIGASSTSLLMVQPIFRTYLLVEQGYFICTSIFSVLTGLFCVNIFFHVVLL
ncbi:hypothetical protein B0J17DRAFT_239676 [Rhizoctonia solani]|nr:hypothetical protein B0J17DRAFT_239676 [Rhizoctonia solani]